MVLTDVKWLTYINVLNLKYTYIVVHPHQIIPIKSSVFYGQIRVYNSDFANKFKQ